MVLLAKSTPNLGVPALNPTMLEIGPRELGRPMEVSIAIALGPVFRCIRVGVEFYPMGRASALLGELASSLVGFLMEKITLLLPRCPIALWLLAILVIMVNMLELPVHKLILLLWLRANWTPLVSWVGWILRSIIIPLFTRFLVISPIVFLPFFWVSPPPLTKL